MYKSEAGALCARTGAPSALVTGDALGSLGVWGWLQSAGSAIGDVFGPITEVAESYIPSGDLLQQGLDAAIQVIRSGTEEQVAATMAQQMTPEQRARLEAEYLRHRAAELAPGIQGAAPWVMAALLAAYLLK